MLIYPSSRQYIRGEDRAQGNVEDSTATSMRAPNDLGYASSTLKKKGYSVFLKDYQTSGLPFSNLKNDFDNFDPDVLFLSITNTTIYKDIETVEKLLNKEKSTVVILKGALFFDSSKELINLLPLDNIDYLIGGESDFIVANLVQCHFENKSKINEIRGIIYKENKTWIKTDFSTWENNVDDLATPDRSAIDNSLYVRPDTGEKQATIITSRGCPSKCVFCLTPTISGTKLRLRSPESIFSEIVECVEQHNIKNFFFRSDTFTIDRRWVENLCNLIVKKNLEKTIQWVANSRVKPLQQETLYSMKEAGCWLVAFGYESGSSETLEKIKKGCTIEDNIRAGEFVKNAKLKSFGFFLIGLPWEGWHHLKDTEKLIFKLNCDFIEIHLAVPYHGTPLYEIAKKEGLIKENVLGKDYFNSPTVGTKYLKMDDIEKFKKNLLLKYHLRPNYIMKRLSEGLKNPKVFMNYTKYGTRLIKRNLFKKSNISSPIIDKTIKLDENKIS